MDRNSPEFKKLQKEWYAKAKESGFDDIEQEDGNLKVWSHQFFKVRHNQTLFEAKQEYYRLAGQFLHSHKFADDVEKKIWEYHATDATSIRDIVKELANIGVKTNKNKVNAILRNLSEQMLKEINDRE